MTINFYQDNQELFQGCTNFYDGTVNSSNQLIDVVGGAHGTKNGSFTTGNVDRFNLNHATGPFSDVNTWWELPAGAGCALTGTCIMWTKIANGNSQNHQALSGAITNSNRGVGFLTSGTAPTTITFQIMRAGCNYYSVSTIPNLSYTDWYMLAITYNSSTTHYGYINGSLMQGSYGTNPQPYMGNPSRMIIGKDGNGINNGDSLARAWTAPIGEVIFFNRMLSATEIKTIYDITRHKYLYPVQSGNRAVE